VKTPTSLPHHPVSADGHYSLALASPGPFLFVSGQGPWNPERGVYERGSIARQTKLTLETIRFILEQNGATMENIVSCRVFLQPLTAETFEEMNGVYCRYFPSNRPVRTTVGAQLLDIDVEIDCIASMPVQR